MQDEYDESMQRLFEQLAGGDSESTNKELPEAQKPLKKKLGQESFSSAVDKAQMKSMRYKEAKEPSVTPFEIDTKNSSSGNKKLTEIESNKKKENTKVGEILLQDKTVASKGEEMTWQSTQKQEASQENVQPKNFRGESKAIDRDTHATDQEIQ